ncbi:unnamed protein product [Eretmochelys imbricata]
MPHAVFVLGTPVKRRRERQSLPSRNTGEHMVKLSTAREKEELPTTTAKIFVFQSHVSACWVHVSGDWINTAHRTTTMEQVGASNHCPYPSARPIALCIHTQQYPLAHL